MYNHQALTRSFYIHWPFCPYKCHFCPFVALAGQDQFMERYHKALVGEIKHFVEQCDQKIELETIYMGGGTPSTYPDHLLLDMYSTLRDTCAILPTCEVTIEVNPGTVRNEQLAVWKRAGINRLSIGVQSLKDSVLKDLNRHQSAQDVFAVVTQASKEFDNISVDLILGLPGVSEQEWKDMVQTMVQLPIQHMSVYFLTVHEDTPLYFKVKKQMVTLPCDDALVDLYSWTVDFLALYGFARYEVSSFARDGHTSAHNSVYWMRKPYKAFGIGACSFDGQSRFQNEKNIIKYMTSREQGHDVNVFSELLTDKQAYLERVMLGIRQACGVALEDIMEGLSEDEQQRFKEQVGWLQQNGYVTQSHDRLVLTPAGLAVEHTIALQLSL